MKIKLKLTLITAGLATIILVMFLATYYVTNKQKSDGLLINLAGRQRMLSQKLAKEIHHAYTSATLVEGEKIENEFVAKANGTIQIFDKTLAALLKGGEAPLSIDPDNSTTASCPVASPEVTLQLQTVNKLWQPFKKSVTNVFSGKQGFEADIKYIHSNNLNLLKEMNKAVIMMQKNAESSVTTLLMLQLGGLLSGIVLSVLAYFMLTSIFKRLDKITVFSQSIGQGNLQADSQISGNDEIGIIGNSLDQMTKKLHRLFSSIAVNTNDIDEVSGSLADIAEELNSGSSEMSGRSQTVAAAAEEMSANMSTVAAATEQASTNIAFVSTSTEEMSSTILEIAVNTDKAQKITETAVSEAQSASEKVDELGKAADEIGKVTETITEISEQTNLLALNATIEAARAGEAGKGFAVVANEIKDLAKQTAEATQEIKNRIFGIQNSTSATVVQIGQITMVINEVNEIVSTIVAAVDEQKTTTGEIADNINQASLGIQEVTENVAQLSTVATEVSSDISEVSVTSKAVEEIANVVQNNGSDLSKQVNDLTEIVKQVTL